MKLRFNINEGLNNATKLARSIIRKNIINTIKYLNEKDLFKDKIFKKKYIANIPVKNEFNDELFVVLKFIPRKEIDNNPFSKSEIIIKSGSYIPTGNIITISLEYGIYKNQIINKNLILRLNGILEHELRHWYQVKFNQNPKFNYSHEDLTHDNPKDSDFSSQQEKDKFYFKQFKNSFLTEMEIDSYLRADFILKNKIGVKNPNYNWNNAWTFFIEGMIFRAEEVFHKNIPFNFIYKTILTQFAPKAFSLLSHIQPKIAQKIDSKTIHQNIYNFIENYKSQK